jgi:hypothetical protein
MASETMKAGRELDGEVGRVVFGFYQRDMDGHGLTWVKDHPQGHQVYASCTIDSPRLWGSDSWGDTLPRFSTSHTAAFAVVERMRELGYGRFDVNAWQDGVWQARFYELKDRMLARACPVAESNSAPEAICVAALSALQSGEQR